MVELNSPIDEVLTTYPQVTGLLVRLRMMCAGCDVARFHTVQEVADVYKLDSHTFLLDIRKLTEATNQAAISGNDSRLGVIGELPSSD